MSPVFGLALAALVVFGPLAVSALVQKFSEILNGKEGEG